MTTQPQDLGEDGQPRTEFDYFLNAADRAGHMTDPAAHGFHEKRLALFRYVRSLERIAAAARTLLTATQDGQ